jgi:hypothetical protein
MGGVRMGEGSLSDRRYFYYLRLSGTCQNLSSAIYQQNRRKTAPPKGGVFF